MIKGLMGSQGIVVSGGNTSLPYIGSNTSNPMTGMIRINGTDMEVFNGNSWQMLSTSYATVSLDQEVLDVIQWARTQRTMAMNRLTLAENNPALMKVLKRIMMLFIEICHLRTIKTDKM
jgi:hypothetical protein